MKVILSTQGLDAVKVEATKQKLAEFLGIEAACILALPAGVTVQFCADADLCEATEVQELAPPYHRLKTATETREL